MQETKFMGSFVDCGKAAIDRLQPSMVVVANPGFWIVNRSSDCSDR